jgi:DNA-binding response OmpR family regulator
MIRPISTLVVDDEPGIRFFLEETLLQAGHSVVTACNGEEALEQLRGTRFDLVLLDLMLGGRVDGLRVLEAVKWRWPKTAVVILTAHGSLDSALAAIREGVDGYLIKPVDPSELKGTARDVLERRRRLVQPEEKNETETLLEHGPFSIDLQKQLATFGGRLLELTPSEFDLLAYLMQNAYRAVSPKELVRVVRQCECEDLNEARQIIKWYVHCLRRKVEPDPSQPRYILTVRGVGYRFVE